MKKGYPHHDRYVHCHRKRSEYHREVMFLEVLLIKYDLNVWDP